MCLACLLLVSLVQADELPVPKLTGRVVDMAGLLSADEVAKVDRALRQFETDTGGQMVVLIIASLKGESIEAFSLRVANTWGIGHKGKDDGLVFTVAVQDRRTRLEVGNGY